MSLEAIGKFIGPDEIVSTDVVSLKTPSGKEVIEVTFKTGKKRLYPLVTLEYIITDEASDYTSVMEKRMTPLRRSILELLLEHDISIGEIEMLFKYVGMDIDSAFNRATNQLWFNDDSQFVPGSDPMYNVSLLMADKILKEIPNDNKNNGE